MSKEKLKECLKGRSNEKSMLYGKFSDLPYFILFYL